MIFEPISLEGAYLITLPTSHDARGTFVKTFHEGLMAKHGIQFTLRESYYSFSKKDVIRGMHFQLPPHDHSKFVFCPTGAIMDVIVDLRKGSATYRQYCCNELSADNHKALYIPEGFAHGFKSLADGSMTYYLLSSVYNKEHDTGVRYDSIELDWGVAQPIISDRDRSFVGLEEFASPF
jgi:dTDP-4-dehydrorhamnose 3,5-epimerase